MPKKYSQDRFNYNLMIAEEIARDAKLPPLKGGSKDLRSVAEILRYALVAQVIRKISKRGDKQELDAELKEFLEWATDTYFWLGYGLERITQPELIQMLPYKLRSACEE